MGGIAGARWQGDDQLHLTLRFVGEVDRHIARDVDAALAGIRHPAFTLQISGFGAFDRRGIATAVWAGVAPTAPVRALHRKVDQAMARVGLPPEPRAFTPHITLARLNRGCGPIATFLAGGGRTGPAFPVDTFHLFESRLTPDGAVYTSLERYPFA